MNNDPNQLLAVYLACGLCLLVAAGWYGFFWWSRRAADRPPSGDKSLAARCSEAYVTRDYHRCADLGRQMLGFNTPPTAGLLTVIALRRLGRANAAEAYGRQLLSGPLLANMQFLLLMRVLDDDLDAERYLRERAVGPDLPEFTPEWECQVNFYWGARLLTAGEATQAARVLQRAAEIDCDIDERRLAQADLQTAQGNI